MDEAAAALNQVDGQMAFEAQANQKSSNGAIVGLAVACVLFMVSLGLLHGSSHQSKGTVSKQLATPTTSHQRQGSITNSRTTNLMLTNSVIENKRDNLMTASPRSAA